ncbi:uncharacterized protein LOC142906710 isoform X2 [Petromyzon marinus]|uniref:uncharacterized protein LOC142906710 isoform X2 n=1 Tax=Petromyzon marinus TaxID=7757 RepID=UPI003F703FCF
MAEELLMKSRFVSEAALEEKRKQRQSEWERVRQPEDPVECPEEEYDARSLFERLQEQKDKKQAEYDEQFKFKNMVRGLETDEVDFLSEVSKQQELLDRRRIIEDRRAILEYRDAVVRRASALEKELPDRSDKRAAVAVTAAAAAPAAPAEAKLKPKPRPSQTQLLAGAVKRRSSSSNNTDEMTVPKRPRGGEGVATDSPATTASRELAGAQPGGKICEHLTVGSTLSGRTPQRGDHLAEETTSPRRPPRRGDHRVTVDTTSSRRGPSHASSTLHHLIVESTSLRGRRPPHQGGGPTPYDDEDEEDEDDEEDEEEEVCGSRLVGGVKETVDELAGRHFGRIYFLSPAVPSLCHPLSPLPPTHPLSLSLCPWGHV